MTDFIIPLRFGRRFGDETNRHPPIEKNHKLYTLYNNAFTLTN